MCFQKRFLSIHAACLTSYTYTLQMDTGLTCYTHLGIRDLIRPRAERPKSPAEPRRRVQHCPSPHHLHHPPIREQHSSHSEHTALSGEDTRTHKRSSTQTAPGGEQHGSQNTLTNISKAISGLLNIQSLTHTTYSSTRPSGVSNREPSFFLTPLSSERGLRSQPDTVYLNTHFSFLLHRQMMQLYFYLYGFLSHKHTSILSVIPVLEEDTLVTKKIKSSQFSKKYILEALSNKTFLRAAMNLR